MNRHKSAIVCLDCSEKVRSLILEKVQNIMAHALRRGIIKKLSPDIKCVDCGKPAKCYDHRDYFKPLDVEPVCISCNRFRGPAKNRENFEEAEKHLKLDIWIKTKLSPGRSKSYNEKQK